MLVARCFNAAPGGPGSTSLSPSATTLSGFRRQPRTHRPIPITAFGARFASVPPAVDRTARTRAFPAHSGGSAPENENRGGGSLHSFG
ncbi:hypothetical protein KPATCC21470_2646 [Kitasatospora purpeofusca]